MDSTGSTSPRIGGHFARATGAPIPDFERLRGLFERYEDIQAVYVFGSVARGTARAGSDLDLAIVPRGPALRSRKLDLLADLASLGFCNVDLLFLDRADVVTQYEAVRENRLIYEAGDFDRGAMYSRVVRQYLDFLPYLNLQRAAYKRRILSGEG
jgi:predicted nucleotidyltransferase